MILSSRIGRNDTRDLERLGASVDSDLLKMVSAAQFVALKHIRRHSSGATVGKRSERFGRTARGNLARSWLAEPARRDQGGIKGPLYSNHPGSRILEEGGTITPTRAGALAIPIHPLADRKTPGDFTRGSGIGETSLVKTARGAFIVLHEAASSAFLFILKSSVTIPPYRYLTNAIRDAGPEIDTITNNGIRLSIGGRS